jgi:GntR family negative regulator for fad regulon and positive regulator of fabA
MEWDAPLRPAELTEARLITAILEGHFPANSSLPPERELAHQLGVTRPTLREALQRMARDGWIEIQHGRLTRVRDYWEEGNLGVLNAIVRNREYAPPEFVPNLLDIRLLLAPAYIRKAVARDPGSVCDRLEGLLDLPDTPAAFAQADWHLHRQLAILSGNPIFTLILNSFAEFYHSTAERYFSLSKSRARSRSFYQALSQAAAQQDPDRAERVTFEMMRESRALWQAASQEKGGAP